MDWPRILAYITGTVDQELLLRNEYLVAENRILKEQVNGRLLLSDVERKTLAEIGYRLGRKTLEDVANAAKPDTILGWYRKLVAQKFDGSKARRKVGRPQVDDDIEQVIVRMARENPIRPSDVVALRRAWLAARWSASTTRGHQSRFVVLKTMEASDISADCVDQLNSSPQAVGRSITTNNQPRQSGADIVAIALSFFKLSQSESGDAETKKREGGGLRRSR
jgi:hypothetical protein